MNLQLPNFRDTDYYNGRAAIGGKASKKAWEITCDRINRVLNRIDASAYIASLSKTKNSEFWLETLFTYKSNFKHHIKNYFSELASKTTEPAEKVLFNKFAEMSLERYDYYDLGYTTVRMNDIEEQILKDYMKERNLKSIEYKYNPTPTKNVNFARKKNVDKSLSL